MLGISIYPEHQKVDEIIDYISRAKKLGYKRIFASLLEINDDNKDNIINKFKKIINYSRILGYEFILDVNPAIFEFLNIKYTDLRFFAELNCSGIRLDEIISPKDIADMTHNKYNLDIEVNCSNSKYLIDSILEFEPVRTNLIACHNFYPQNLTGLDYDYFMDVTSHYKKNNIRTAAFISANKDTAPMGPWPINDGICTIEDHRKLPIHTQAKMLFATNVIDDVLIGNAFATQEELEIVASVNYGIIELDVEFNGNVSDIEKEIALDFEHFRRGDITPMMVRSTFPRVEYKEHDFPSHDNDSSLKRGDIIVGNNDFKTYKGELHLILNDLDVDARKNKIGRIKDYDLDLLDKITPWKRFKLIERTK